MRKIILGLAVSLDGFIEGPNGEYDWCFTDQDYGLSDFFKRVDTVFIGRKTYQMTLEMSNKGGSGFPKFKEYIFSTTLDKVKEGAILIKEDIKTEVSKIKKEEGKDIWLFGGAGLTTSLMNLDLIDEVSLAVHPILLGGGKPLFKNIKRKSLSLVDTKTYSTGLVSLTYTTSNL
ncbi:dihydrofolate reductase family protein [Poritiphilus flavus]|uniref:Dihydrofolate reductase n=1 Tax=Poritiphilus flavus TaxID=2697053 RepID=A0A6L9EBP2_9FLAO|nr:dihydrofolate reductase family protein [Poritiphilus flavus]NAS12150.1 dihydrofolate reductase [Poritiphilus flavus]